MTEWLRHNCEPLSTVSDYMKKTCTSRARCIRDDGKSVAEILDCYPRLLSPGMVSVRSAGVQLKNSIVFVKIISLVGKSYVSSFVV